MYKTDIKKHIKKYYLEEVIFFLIPSNTATIVGLIWIFRLKPRKT